MGFDLTETIRNAILALPETAWRPAIRQDGETARGRLVAEITDALDLGGWPDGTRVIVRRERPHPGAQLSFTDHDGHRFQATLTDLPGSPVELERPTARAPAPRTASAPASRPASRTSPSATSTTTRLARALADRPRPDRLDPGARARRRARHLRTQDAALPAAPHRRPTGLPRPPRDPAPATQLALGRRPRGRLRPTERAPTTRALTHAASPTTSPITPATTGRFRSRPTPATPAATLRRSAPPHGRSRHQRHTRTEIHAISSTTHPSELRARSASGHPTAARPQQPVYLQGIDTPTSSKPCMPTSADGSGSRHAWPLTRARVLIAHSDSDGVRARCCSLPTPAYVVPMRRVDPVESHGALLLVRSKHEVRVDLRCRLHVEGLAFAPARIESVGSTLVHVGG